MHERAGMGLGGEKINWTMTYHGEVKVGRLEHCRVRGDTLDLVARASSENTTTRSPKKNPS